MSDPQDDLEKSILELLEEIKVLSDRVTATKTNIDDTLEDLLKSLDPKLCKTESEKLN